MSTTAGGESRTVASFLQLGQRNQCDTEAIPMGAVVPREVRFVSVDKVNILDQLLNISVYSWPPD